MPIMEEDLNVYNSPSGSKYINSTSGNPLPIPKEIKYLQPKPLTDSILSIDNSD